MTRLSRFCPVCRGDRAVEAVGGTWRDDDYVSVPCPTCGGRGGFGPAFGGDAIPADQEALDLMNAKAQHPAFGRMPGASTAVVQGLTNDSTRKA